MYSKLWTEIYHLSSKVFDVCIMLLQKCNFFRMEQNLGRKMWYLTCKFNTLQIYIEKLLSSWGPLQQKKMTLFLFIQLFCTIQLALKNCGGNSRKIKRLIVSYCWSQKSWQWTRNYAVTSKWRLRSHVAVVDWSYTGNGLNVFTPDPGHWPSPCWTSTIIDWVGFPHHLLRRRTKYCKHLLGGGACLVGVIGIWSREK